MSYRVVAVLPVHGRHSLLPFTLRRLLQQTYPLHSIVCVGGTREEQAICEKHGATFFYYRNYPLGAKWQFGVDVARNLGGDALLYVGTSDWISDNWVEYLLGKADDDTGIVGVNGGVFVALTGTDSVQAMRFTGYDTEENRKGEPAGAGRIVLPAALDAVGWKLFDTSRDSSLDRAQYEEVKAAGFGIMRIDITDHESSEISKIAIETTAWGNKHSMAKTMQNRKAEELGNSEEWLRERFPEVFPLNQEISKIVQEAPGPISSGKDDHKVRKDLELLKEKFSNDLRKSNVEREPLREVEYHFYRRKLLDATRGCGEKEKDRRKDEYFRRNNITEEQWKVATRKYFRRWKDFERKVLGLENMKGCNHCFYAKDMFIHIDKKGKCDYCKLHAQTEKENPRSWEAFDAAVEKIKEEGRTGRYDCIVGVSGGCDSSYLLHLLIERGVRPLVFHWDNDWNTSEAESNVEALIKASGADSAIIKAGEEYHELNKALLHASVNEPDIPNDIAMTRLGYDLASKHEVNYVLTASDFRTEGPCPVNWTFMDSEYLKRVYAKKYRKKLRNFPLLSWAFQRKMRKRGIKKPRLMYLAEYDKSEAKEILKEKYDWKDYGANHSENIFTYFVGAYLLPRKFGIDKRRLYFSAMVRSGSMKKEDAEHKLETPPEFPPEYLDVVVERYFGGDRTEFDKMMSEEPKKFYDYTDSWKKFIRFKWVLKMLVKVGAVPLTYYRKYTREIPLIIRGRNTD